MPVGRLASDSVAAEEELAPVKDVEGAALSEGVPPSPPAKMAESVVSAGVQGGDESSQLAASAASVVETAAGVDEADAGATTLSVYENERKNLMGSKGFSKENLYAYERGAWSDEDGLPTSKDDPLLLPDGWTWAPGSSWEVEGGWAYGGVTWPSNSEEWVAEENGRSTLVRRRKWCREIVEHDGVRTTLSMRATQAQEQLMTCVVQDGEKVMGTCEAGLLVNADGATDGVLVLTEQRLLWTKSSDEDTTGLPVSEPMDGEPEPELEPEPEPKPSPDSDAPLVPEAFREAGEANVATFRRREPQAEDDPDRTRVVIEVIRAWGLDNYDTPPKIDPYASLELVDMQDQPHSRGRGRTQVRSGTNEPVWRNYLELGTAGQQASIAIEILDELSIMADTKIAVGEIRLRDLPVGEPRMLKLKPFDATGAATTADRSCTILDGGVSPWPHGLDPSNEEQLQKAPGRGTFTPVIQVRRLDPNLAPAQCRMTLFLVRHGESEWNEAKANRRFDVMAKSYDHPLNIKGVRQALRVHHAWSSATPRSDSTSVVSTLPPAPADSQETTAGPADTALADVSLRDSVRVAEPPAENDGGDRDEAENLRVHQILSARRMYASPLTRAVQTAMLAFQDHPCVGERERGMTLLCSAREVKTLGGFDTVGDALGDDIHKRAMEKLYGHLQESEMLARLDRIKMDPEEVHSKWWTSVMDTNETLARRVNELICRVRYDAHVQTENEIEAERESASGSPTARMPRMQTAIVVAHSIIIKEIIRRCTQPGSEFAETPLAAKLGRGKVTNGGVVALDLQFLDNCTDAIRQQPATIESAQLLFGTEVERHGVIGSHDVKHSAIPLHSVVRMEEGWSGLMSTFTLKLKFLATPDGIGTEDGGQITLEFRNRLGRDKLLSQLKNACASKQSQLLDDSLAVDESKILREPCLSCRPAKAACGPELAGVSGGDGGSVLVTMRRLIWIPDCTRTEEALPTKGTDLLATDSSSAAVLSVKLLSISFIESLEERSLSNPMGFSSPGMKVKLRAGGAEHLIFLFSSTAARDKVKHAVDEQRQELLRKDPRAAAVAGLGGGEILHQGPLHKNSPSGMMWQQRWFVLRQNTLVYYNVHSQQQQQQQQQQQKQTAAAGGTDEADGDAIPGVIASKANPKGEIDLRDIKAIWLTNRDGGWHSETEFGIRLDDRVGRAPYELRAPSPEEAAEWIAAIKSAAKALGATTDAGSGHAVQLGASLKPTLSEVQSSVFAAADAEHTTAAPASMAEGAPNPDTEGL